MLIKNSSLSQRVESLIFITFLRSVCISVNLWFHFGFQDESFDLV